MGHRRKHAIVTCFPFGLIYRVLGLILGGAITLSDQPLLQGLSSSLPITSGFTSFVSYHLCRLSTELVGLINNRNLYKEYGRRISRIRDVDHCISTAPPLLV